MKPNIRYAWLAALSLPGLLSTTCHPTHPTNIAWAKTYGTGVVSRPVSLHATSDGGYVLGTTVLDSVRNMQMCMIRTDAEGELVWKRTYPASVDTGHSASSAGGAARQTSDGGFIIAGPLGWVDTNHICRYGAYLVKTDANGDTERTRCYASRYSYYPNSNSVVQLPDGGFVMGGPSSFMGSGASLMRTDSAWDTMWVAFHDGGVSTTVVGSVEPTMDGGFVLPFTSGSETCACLLRVEADGRESWTAKYPTMPYGRAACEAPGGGYVLVGQGWQRSGLRSKSPCFSLARVGKQGQLVREMKVRAGTGCGVELTPDGNYILAGINDYHPCIVKADTAGRVIWDAELVDMYGFFTSAVGAADGGIVAAWVADSIRLVKVSPPNQE